MKKIAAILIAFALPSAMSFAAQAAPGTASAVISAQAAGGQVYVVSGNVFVTQGRNPAHQVVNSEAIVPDTLISTGDKSAALLKFADGQIITMHANSALHVFDYRYDAQRAEASSIVLSMFKGGMRFVTGLIGQRRKQSFRLLTPNATIGIRGTEFMVTMVNNSMYSQVLTGNIAMINGAGSVVLGAGQTAVVASSSALATLISAAAIPPGTFTDLLSIPVNPSALTAPAAPAPTAPVTPVAPATPAAPIPAIPVAPAVSVPLPAVTSGAALGVTAGKGAGAAGAGAVTSAGAGLGLVAGALVGSDKDKPKPSIPAKPVAIAVPVANQENIAEKSRRSGIALIGKLGTLGYGVELGLGSSDKFSTRIGLNSFTRKYNANSSAVNYDFKLQLQTASLLGDWYPFAGSFRTSGGVLYNNNKISLNAKPTNGNYVINGANYTSAQIGTLQATLTFNKVAPYFGIGWGNPVAQDKGWGMTSDLGVLFQGKPKVDMTVTCASSCPQLQTDAAAENTKLQNDLSNFKFWPVASIGISYQW